MPSQIRVTVTSNQGQVFVAPDVGDREKEMQVEFDRKILARKRFAAATLRFGQR